MPKLAKIALVLACARSASATGVCEGTETRYDAPTLFDPKTRSFAVDVASEWCAVSGEDTGAPTEVRGSISYVELRDVAGHVLDDLAAVTGADAVRLKSELPGVVLVPAGKLHAQLVARGYAPLTTVKTKCQVAATWGASDHASQWASAPLYLDVTAAGKSVAHVLLGTGSVARRGDQVLRTQWLPAAKQLAVFAVVPACDGPPPGYFGPDDGGSCYRKGAAVTLALDLPGCF